MVYLAASERLAGHAPAWDHGSYIKQEEEARWYAHLGNLAGRAFCASGVSWLAHRQCSVYLYPPTHTSWRSILGTTRCRTELGPPRIGLRGGSPCAAGRGAALPCTHAPLFPRATPATQRMGRQVPHTARPISSAFPQLMVTAVAEKGQSPLCQGAAAHACYVAYLAHCSHAWVGGRYGVAATPNGSRSTAHTVRVQLRRRSPNDRRHVHACPPPSSMQSDSRRPGMRT